MKHPFVKSLLILAVLAALFASTTAYCADRTDQMVAKVIGPGKSNGLIPPTATAASALIDKNNNILLSAYGGSLVSPDGGTIAQESVTTLTSAATISFRPSVKSSVFKLTPAHTATINAVIAGGVPGRSYTFVVTTSGTTSYTLTFGTAFKTTATLATGTTTAKVFVLTFVFDGTNFNEVSRTAAM